jgi:zinc/manganese transport system substrate-binding protein
MGIIPVFVRLGAVSLLALIPLAGCGSGATGDASDGPVVVATTSILGDITANVVGDLARVEVLMPRGTDPHDFEPSARQVASLRSADLVVANGLELEEGLESVLDAAAADGVTVLEVAPLLDPQTYEGGDQKKEDAEDAKDGAIGDDRDHVDDAHGEGLDPHVWMDVARVQAMAGLIAEALTGIEGIDSEALEANLESYETELAALDSYITDILAAVPEDRRFLVTNHDAFGYLAASQDFEIVGTVLPGGSPLAEPSPAELSALAEQLAVLGIPAIFTDNTMSADLANTLANEVPGVTVVGLYSDSLGPEDSDATTYVSMMRSNAQRIAAALT